MKFLQDSSKHHKTLKLESNITLVNKKLKDNLAIGATFASLLTAGLFIVGQYYGIPELKDTVKKIESNVNEQGKSIARIEGKLNRRNINFNNEDYTSPSEEYVNSLSYTNSNNRMRP